MYKVRWPASNSAYISGHDLSR